MSKSAMLEGKLDDTLLLLTRVNKGGDRKKITDLMVKEHGPCTDRLLERGLITMGSKRYEAYFRTLASDPYRGRPVEDPSQVRGIVESADEKLRLNNKIFFLSGAGYQRAYELGRVRGYYNWRARRLPDDVHSRMTTWDLNGRELSFMESAVVTPEGVTTSYEEWVWAGVDIPGDGYRETVTRKWSLREFERGFYYSMLYFMQNPGYVGNPGYLNTHGVSFETHARIILLALNDKWCGATGYSLAPTVVEAARTMKMKHGGYIDRHFLKLFVTS